MEEPEESDDSDDEKAGSVVYWADDRGFGFITDNHTGERNFFHASALDYPSDRTYLANSFGAADFDDEVWYTPKPNNERAGTKAFYVRWRNVDYATTMSNLLVVILHAQVFTGRSRDVLGGEVYQPEWYRLSRELE